jgi:hypothetical protein
VFVSLSPQHVTKCLVLHSMYKTNQFKPLCGKNEKLMTHVDIFVDIIYKKCKLGNRFWWGICVGIDQKPVLISIHTETNFAK